MLKFSTQLQHIQKSIIIMKIMETIEIDPPTGSLRPALFFFSPHVYTLLANQNGTRDSVCSHIASKYTWAEKTCRYYII